MTTISYMLHLVFRGTADRRHLDEALVWGNSAYVAAGEDSATRVGVAVIQAVSMKEHYDEIADGALLDHAVHWMRVSLPERSSRIGFNERLAHLGILLSQRFIQNSARVDIDEAIIVLRQSIAHTHGDDSTTAVALRALAEALWTRFTRFGDPADDEERIRTLQSELRCILALEERSLDSMHAATINADLCLAMTRRYRRTGDVAALDHAIESGLIALDRAPGRYQADWSADVAAALTARFQRSGAAQDADRAATYWRLAVARSGSEHPMRARWESYAEHVATAATEPFGDGRGWGDERDRAAGATPRADAFVGGVARYPRIFFHFRLRDSFAYWRQLSSSGE